MAQIMDQYWRSRGTSRTKYVWTPTHRFVVGKTVRRNSIGTLKGKSAELGMSLCSSKTRIIFVSIRGRHQNGWKEAEYGSHVEEIHEKCWSWRKPSLPGLHSTWMWTERNYFWWIQKMFESRISAGATEKITRMGKPSRKDGCVVLRCGSTCSKMRWEMLRSGEQKDSRSTKSQVFASMTTIAKKRNSNQLENCQKFALLKKLVLGTKWTTWHLVVSQQACWSSHKIDVCSQIVLQCLYFARIGRPDILWSVNKLARAVTKNGLRLATDAWQDWFHTFITQMTTDIVVMWVTRLSIVDGVYSKTQNLLATLRTQNQSQVGFYVSLEVEHPFPWVGCARNKRQCPTVLQNLKAFRWMLDCEWMDYLLLTSGMW